ncbi:hypothetical protein CEXT_749661 [Caerostris extrusa]|uniref:Uncharacterized protein n=1 Tax=Caerostris extrusa TaxID=172846 RepID=A0AAV4NMS2_CAEEX|nr:hypothetical protein CEXT_749661 [Caerostris extrusa]
MYSNELLDCPVKNRIQKKKEPLIFTFETQERDSKNGLSGSSNILFRDRQIARVRLMSMQIAEAADRVPVGTKNVTVIVNDEQGRSSLIRVSFGHAHEWQMEPELKKF